MKFLYLGALIDLYKTSFYLFFLSKFLIPVYNLLNLQVLFTRFFLSILDKIILNVNFYNVLFNKEKILTQFLLLEIITGQKPFFTFTKKTNPELNIEKGFLNGAKVTIRRDNLFLLLFTLFLSFFNRNTFFQITTKTYLSLNFLINSSLIFLMYNFLKRNYFNMMLSWNNCFYKERMFFFSWNKLDSKFINT